MRDMPFPDKKNLVQEQLAQAFSQDYLTVSEYEERVEALEAADTFAAVEALVSDLPRDLIQRPGASLSVDVGAQVLEGGGQVIRRRGGWLRSNHLVVRQQGSTVRLRLDDLAAMSGSTLHIELDLQGCTARIKVPVGTRIVDDVIAHGSMFRISRKIRRRGTQPGATVVVTGSISSSTVRFSRL